MNGVLDHTMIRVTDLEASLEWYGNHLGYEEKARWEAENFTNVHLGPEEVHEQGALVELTHNHGVDEYDLGDSWGHLAVRVGDVYDAYGELTEAGVEDYRDPDSCGGSYAFVRDPDGYEIELVERDHGERWSLDHTMLRVEEPNRAIGYFVRTFDYELVRRSEHDSFALYFLKPRDAAEEAMTVELTYNYDGRSYEAGNGWGHLAVRTDDLVDYWETLVRRGSADYRDPESCDYNYAFTKDREGHEIEVLDPAESPMDRS